MEAIYLFTSIYHVDVSSNSQGSSREQHNASPGSVGVLIVTLIYAIKQADRRFFFLKRRISCVNGFSS